MKISYRAMEEGFLLLTGDGVVYQTAGGAPTMFVHPRTYRDIKAQLYDSHTEWALGVWLNPQTGRQALMFEGGYIERRRWVPAGWMMGWRLGRTLGSVPIVQSRLTCKELIDEAIQDGQG